MAFGDLTGIKQRTSHIHEKPLELFSLITTSITLTYLENKYSEHVHGPILKQDKYTIHL